MIQRMLVCAIIWSFQYNSVVPSITQCHLESLTTQLDILVCIITSSVW